MPIEASQALVKAQELALRQQMHMANTTLAKNEFEYWLDELAARQQPSAPPTELLKAYTGRYGPLRIYIAKNKLFCQNAGSNNLITELKYIAHSRFVLDDSAHIEFVSDSPDNCTRVKLYVNDGAVFEEKRQGDN